MAGDVDRIMRGRHGFNCTAMSVHWTRDPLLPLLTADNNWRLVGYLLIIIPPQLCVSN